MLSSAKKSVPTNKQFLQPYFVEIRRDGTVKSVCARTIALLQKKNIYNFLERNFIEVFGQWGRIENPSTSPALIDLSIDRSGGEPFLIRWSGAPLQSEDNPDGWQLTGVRVHARSFTPPSSLQAPSPSLQASPCSLQASSPSSSLSFAILDAVSANASDIILATDAQERVIYWNKAAERFFGIPASQILGKRFGDHVRYEYPGLSVEKAKMPLERQGFWDGELAWVSDTGKKSYLICTVRPLMDSDHAFSGTITINRDITEHRTAQQDKHRTELQLRRFAEQISDILGSITDGFFVLDKGFRVILWNHEAEMITDLAASVVVGKAIWEILPELVESDACQAFYRAFENKMTVTIEQYNKEADRWLEMSVYPSRDGLFSYFKDVTQRKKQETLLALEKMVLERNTDKGVQLRVILDEFLEGIQQTFPGMLCCVLTLDEDGRSVRLLSAPGLPAVYSNALDGLPIGPAAGSCGTAMFLKRNIIVGDIATDPLWKDHKELAMQFGLRACSSVPVVNREKEVLAALSVYYTTPRTPSELEWDVIGRAARLVTLIIESKRAEERLLRQEVYKQKMIAQAMVDAQEKERAEISKELHDNINQILSTTKLYLELAKNDNKERISLINRSAGNIHEAIHEIRNISRSLVPSSIGDLGLLDSITDLVEGVRTTRTIHVEFYPVGIFEENISQQKKLMLFRILQEQVNNVLKHARARNLIIELTLDDRESKIELSITDDGIGFDPEMTNKKGNNKGQGLSNIMSRADLFGGMVRITSSPGKGCQLKVQLPLN